MKSTGDLSIDKDVLRGGHQYYAAVVRAYANTPLIVDLVTSLKRQTIPPQAIIIVDSSGTSETAASFAALGAVVVPYPDEPFNYSKAINIGVEANEHPYTLVISSHMQLIDEGVIEHGLVTAREESVDVLYWAYLNFFPEAPERTMLIGQREFTGKNGISNCMCLIPTDLLKHRPFREDVFSAEDQEWTKYYLKKFQKSILRLESHRVVYRNPNHGEMYRSETKILNERLAIGHFVNRRLIFVDKIGARILRGLVAVALRRPQRAAVHFGFAWAMTLANFSKPKRQSRYF